MFNMKIKRVIGLVVLLVVAGGAFASIRAARVNDDIQPPVLPSPLCDSVRVPAGNEVATRLYAKGSQIYRWDGSSWVFVGPEARLYADPNYQAEVGMHYAGPYWESYSGSKVRGSKMEGCTPDPNAIDWLKLRAVETSGPGVFSSTTFIQRVNTAGGKAPTTPGQTVGEVANVPYTTEYYFYHPQE